MLIKIGRALIKVTALSIHGWGHNGEENGVFVGEEGREITGKPRCGFDGQRSREIQPRNGQQFETASTSPQNGSRCSPEKILLCANGRGSCERKKWRTCKGVAETLEMLLKEHTMPLKKSASKNAFAKNVKTEMAAGKPQKQAVAIAYSVQRKAATPKKGK